MFEYDFPALSPSLSTVVLYSPTSLCPSVLSVRRIISEPNWLYQAPLMFAQFCPWIVNVIKILQMLPTIEVFEMKDFVFFYQI